MMKEEKCGTWNAGCRMGWEGVARWDDIAGQHRNCVRASEPRVKVPTLACFHFASGMVVTCGRGTSHSAAGVNKRRCLGLIGLPSPLCPAPCWWTSFWDDKYGNFPWAVVK